MIQTEHRVSELINMYKKLAELLHTKTNTKAAHISNHVTKQNLMKSLSSLNISTILVAGESAADWGFFLAKNGFEVTIVHNDIDYLKNIETKIHMDGLSLNLAKGNINSIPFNNEEFDLAFAEGSLISFIEKPEKLLMEFRRVTKTGGYVWINYLNLMGWAMLQPDVESRMKLISQEDEIIYMGKDRFPLRFFSPKKLRYLLYDAGFLELNEFGNGILTNPLMDDITINGAESELLKSELALSRNYNMIGAAFHIQVLAQKIIY
jgi:ubiquinone/menaquinone biosynthesis C-methylase UbiE